MGKRPNNAPTSAHYEVIPTTLQMFDKFRKMPPCRKNNPTEIEKRVSEYFRLCGDYNVQCTVEGLVCATGVSRQTLIDWQNDKGSEAGVIITRAKDLINALMTDATFRGEVNYIFTIWMQKNHYKYSDNPTVIELKNANGEQAAIEQKIENAGLIWSEQLQDFIIDKGVIE